jgi:hypothetical protein
MRRYNYENTVIVSRFETSTVRALNSDCGMHFGAYLLNRVEDQQGGCHGRLLGGKQPCNFHDGSVGELPIHERGIRHCREGGDTGRLPPIFYTLRLTEKEFIDFLQRFLNWQAI